MVTQYDEKGKIFTQVVAKEPVQVIIQTAQNQIHGAIHVRPGTRLKDELNEDQGRFLAITDATIYTLQQEELYHCGFLVIHYDQIVWMFPKEEIIR